MRQFLRFFVAAVLLFAALAKAAMLATIPTLPVGGWFGLLEIRWVQIVTVEFEIFWALLLIFNPFPRLIWCGSAVLFVAFAVVSVAKWLLGEASCGCFGRVGINPLYTAIFDAVVVGMLLLFRKHSAQNVENSVRKCVIAAIVWVAVSLPIMFAVNSVQTNDLSLLGSEFIGADGRKAILLEPEKWIGNEFPLLPYIEPAEVREKLKTGEWTVVLYHHDCPKCKEVIAEMAADGVPNVVGVEVPPYGGGTVLPVGFVSARLTDRLVWFIETPLKQTTACGQILFSGTCETD